MKTHTNQFKTNVKELGRELDSIITYGQTTLHDELYSVSYHYKADILKSVMKQLDVTTSVDIPLNTVINYRLGIKVGNSFEYLDYGNYVVYKSEKQKDKNLYKLTCYDKILYSMKDYESMNITYPITIRNYINTICNKLGLTFANINDTFANYKKEIQNELYLDTEGNSLGYTFRDVLDELAQVTGSIICINKDDELEIRYINNTNDTINEQYLKDINVNFGESYGAVNVLVLSRSSGTDNIYYPQELPVDRVEIKISDNQIMNFNNRADFMPDIYNKINGLEYYINDFKSTGILYYDLYDQYNVQIGNDTYKCLMLNDEINVTTGIEETIYTDMPIESKTDYTKADKTDRKINQTALIVDKQNQQLQSVVSQIGDRSQKTTTITQDIDGINSKVEDLEDLTKTVTGIQTVTISDAYPNENLLELHIYGNNSVFDYLYPQDDLYPADTLYPYGDSRIRFYNDEVDNTIELGIEEVLRANLEAKDEVFIDYQGNVSLIRRVNANGTTKATPTTTVLGQLHFTLIEGNNTFEVVNYNAPIEIKYVAKSTYTEIFATRVEMNSEITQTANEIDLSVNKKLESYSTTQEMNSKISQTAQEINLSVNNKLEDYSTTTQMNAQIQLTADSINSEVSKKVGNNEVISKINQSAEQIQINANKISLARKTNKFNWRKYNNNK